MRLICHIGTPKTAAPLIQSSLVANRPWLAEHGISHPDLLAADGNHIALFFACSAQVTDFSREYGLHSTEELLALRKRLSEHIKAHIDQLGGDIHTVILSAESLTGRLHHPDEIARLKNLLSPFFEEIVIVAYTRRQDDAILATYGEFIQDGLTDVPFRDFVDLCCGANSPTPYLFYRKTLAPWVNIWGKDNIVIRRFSPMDFIDGTIVADFMGIVQNTWEPDMNGFVFADEAAPGLSAPMLELLRRLSPYISAIKDGKPNPGRRRLAPLLNTMPTSPRPVMGAETAGLIMQRFQGANTWLRETFFPDLDGPFFPDRPDQPANGNLGHLTLEDCTALTGLLLSKF